MQNLYWVMFGPPDKSRQDDGLEEAGALNGSGEQGLKAYAIASFRHLPNIFRRVLDQSWIGVALRLWQYSVRIACGSKNV